MKSPAESDTETIVVIEDEIVVDTTPTPTRPAGDTPPPAYSFADDPFVVDWAPPQS